MARRHGASVTRRAFLAGSTATVATALAGCTLQVGANLDAPYAIGDGQCSGSLPTPPAGGSGHWPMAGHDGGSSRHNPVESVPTAPAEPEWTRSLPTGHLPSDPVVGPERVYVVIGNYEPTPAEVRLVAFSLVDGTREWRVQLPDAGERVPALAADGDGRPTLFVPSGQDRSNTGPGSGEVLALDPETGDDRRRWPVDRNLAGPAVVPDGRVFVRNNSYGEAAVHALDAASGTELWRFETGDVLHHAPTVAGDTVFASSGRRHLVAIDAADGTTRWEVEAAADATRPTIDAVRGHVLMGHARGLEAYCARSGKRVWNLITTDAGAAKADYLGVRVEPVVTEDVLYLQTSDTSPSAIGDLGHFYGIDPETGEVRWRLSEGRPARHAIGSDGTALLARTRPDGEAQTTSIQPSVSDVAAVTPDGSIAWTRSGEWAPVAVGSGTLLAYRGNTPSIDRQVDIGCFAI